MPSFLEKENVFIGNIYQSDTNEDEKEYYYMHKMDFIVDKNIHVSKKRDPLLSSIYHET